METVKKKVDILKTSGWQALVQHHPRLVDEVIETLLTQPNFSSVVASSRPESQVGCITENADEVPWVTTWSLESLAVWGLGLMSCTSSMLHIMPSLSPGYGSTTRTNPIFIFPGVENPAHIECFTSRLMFPAVCIQTPLLSAVQNVTHEARKLMEVVLFGQARGPYYLLGVGFGCGLAVEVGLLLEAQGKVTKVILLDAVQNVAHALTQQFGTGNQLEVNLLASLLNIKDPKVHDVLSALPNWSGRLSRALTESCITSSQLNTAHLTAAMNHIFYQLTSLVNHKVEGSMKGSLALLTREPKDNMPDYNELCSGVLYLAVEGSAVESKAAATFTNNLLM